jgi:hypothetical protein
MANSHVLCRSAAVPCHRGFRLCLSHLIYTVLPCLIHTRRAAPMSHQCHATTMPFWKRLLKDTAKLGMAWHGTCELTLAIQRRMWVTFARWVSCGYHVEFHDSCYQKHIIPLNCRTSSSGISGYHAVFHEGHGTVREWQGRGMCELAFSGFLRGCKTLVELK